MKKIFRNVLALTILSVALLQTSPSFASPSTQTKAEHKAAKLEQKIQKLDNNIIEAMDNVDQLTKKIKRSNEKIDQTKKEIKQTQTEHDLRKALYEERLRAIQGENKSTIMLYADIVLSSDGISDFIDRTTAVSQILNSDESLMTELNEKEDKLIESKTSLTKVNEELIEDKKDLAKEMKQIKKDKKKIEKKLEATKKTIKEEKAAKRAAKAAQKRAEKAVIEAEKAAASEATKPVQLAAVAPNITKTSNQKDVLNLTNQKPTGGDASGVISYAKNFLGVPYVWGGTSPSGFDCSGLMQYVYSSVGISLPRTSSQQQNTGTRVSPNDVQAGDLVFFGSPAYHVGMYIGNGQWLHAPQTGDVVKIASYNPSMFSSAARVQ
ncbi:C40 family peptidase [Viridibacillus sp. YIM B01967]|uniref:C40 family peptidase n=1 Tax=Viridibacillus soli TaxID=2798301 RepID=A0ABS1H297_9BACL|nr:C40 family peptidase [Viridibacillus soli]MBK3493531.1 C40 family peptidase [Viridibacillus soli]